MKARSNAFFLSLPPSSQKASSLHRVRDDPNPLIIQGTPLVTGSSNGTLSCPRKVHCFRPFRATDPVISCILTDLWPYPRQEQTRRLRLLYPEAIPLRLHRNTPEHHVPEIYEELNFKN